MRYLFILLLLLGAIVGFTLFSQHDPGYVLLNYSGWTVETSLSVLLLSLLLAFVVLHIFLRLLSGTLHLPSRLAGMQRERRARHARKLTNEGLIALAEGHWAQAEKKLSRAATDSETPLIQYLGAARAAQKQDAEERRDDYLSRAFQSMPEAELAVGLTQADVQLSQGQTEQALATLHHLRSIAPKHVHVLYLLKKLYEKLQSWDELFALLPELRKRHVLNEQEYLALEQRVHCQRLVACRTPEQLEQVWQEVPKALRRSADLLHHYADALCRMGAEEQAEAILRDYFKKQWDPRIARLYGRVRGSDLNRQLVVAEHWLGQYEHHPELLLALGRICLHNQLWGKARSYLEASLGVEQRAETCCELGNLLAQLGEKERAAAYFRQGLELVSGDLCTCIEIPASHDGAAAPAAEAPPEPLSEEPPVEDGSRP